MRSRARWDSTISKYSNLQAITGSWESSFLSRCGTASHITIRLWFTKQIDISLEYCTKIYIIDKFHLKIKVFICNIMICNNANYLELGGGAHTWEDKLGARKISTTKIFEQRRRIVVLFVYTSNIWQTTPPSKGRSYLWNMWFWPLTEFLPLMARPH